MKYIAFKGTYNEQIYDSTKNEIVWTNSPEIKAESVSIFHGDTWEMMN